MTYQEATRKLRELAGDKYNSCAYVTRTFEGEPTVCCELYIEDAGHTASGETFELAFERLAIYRGEELVPADQEPVIAEAKEVA